MKGGKATLTTFSLQSDVPASGASDDRHMCDRMTHPRPDLGVR